jgi:putative CRISPR-associated protein (TIGR02620 family)
MKIQIDLVVTRHPALLQHLKDLGVVTDKTQVISHATPDDVKGLNVCGVLPYSLACLCTTFSELTLNIPQGIRGQELSLDELKKYAGPLITYKVQRTYHS